MTRGAKIKLRGWPLVLVLVLLVATLGLWLAANL